MKYRLFLLYWSIRNKLFPPYTGPTSAMYIGLKGEDEYTYTPFKLTKGKIYHIERQDRVSYYLHDDNNQFEEVTKIRFKDISKDRDKKLRKLGI